MYTPYKDDPDEFSNKNFSKLSTCAKSCSNKGVFANLELDDILDMDTATSAQCPFL